MGLSEHYRGGQTERMAVTIVTSDPMTGRIEGVGRDAAIIQIQPTSTGSLLRWPAEQELWSITRENGVWTLDSVLQADLPSEFAPGDGFFSGGAIYTSLGHQIDQGSGRANVLLHKADPTAFRDSSEAFASAWETNKTVYVPTGVYAVDDEAFVGNKPLVLEGDGPDRTIIQLNGVNLARITGSIGTTVALTASANLGDTTLTVASTTGLVAGDYLIVRDTTQVLPGTTASPYAGVVGEVARIKSVNSPTSVTIWGAIQQQMTLGAGNLTARKISMVNNVIVRNCTIINPNPSTYLGGNARALQLDYCHRVRVENVSFVQLDDDGVNLDSCVDWRVTNCDFYDLQNTGGRTPYGVVASNACVNGIVSGCRQTYGRHIFTTGGDDGEIGPAHTLVTNCVAWHSTTNPFDTHPAGRHVVFNNCLAHSNIGGGFHIRTPKSRVQGCYVVGTASAAGITLGGSATGSTVCDSEIRGVTTGVDVQAEDCDVLRMKIEGSAYGVRVRSLVDLVGAAIIKSRVRDITVIGNPSVGGVVMNGTDTTTRIIERIYAPDATTPISPARAVDLEGAGTPEGNVTAGVGSTYRRRNGGAGTSFYVKESGTGNTGWVPK